MSAADALGFASSYYVATRHPAPARPTLKGEERADICVVGGGVTGISAALHAAQQGFDVILLEAAHIGWGASGRNGGQMIPGLRKGALELIKRHGRPRARALFDLAIEARDLVETLAHDHAIACDFTPSGHLLLAAKPGDMDWMRAEEEALRTDMDYAHVETLSMEFTRARVNSALYHGALFDARGGHLHPLNFTLGLAAAAQAAGVRIFERTPARALQTGKGFIAETPDGRVIARHGVIACDALLDGLVPTLAAHVMPIGAYQIATAPLDDHQALIPRNEAVSDSRFVVNYFRRTGDGRLLFGGGERYAPAPPHDIAAFVKPYMLRVFPHLRGARIDHAWGGLVSITRSRLPHVGRLGEAVFAQGYSGQGVLLSALAGKLMAEAIQGLAARFDLFASLAPPAFPGGARLRDPLYMLGMLWAALRDRL